jgi:hypothetical protein
MTMIKINIYFPHEYDHKIHVARQARVLLICVNLMNTVQIVYLYNLIHVLRDESNFSRSNIVYSKK